jgi:hypothetical protein
LAIAPRHSAFTARPDIMTNQETVRSSFFPRLIGIAAILAVHFFSLVMLILVFCSVVPKYLDFFDSWNLELPEMTILAITMSFACCNYWYLAVLLLPADAIIVIMLSLLGTKRSWILSVYCHLVLLTVIFLLLFVIVSMAVPIASIPAPSLLA